MAFMQVEAGEETGRGVILMMFYPLALVQSKIL
jgi:hypothetical protein